jgi:hypothetical protein
MSYPSEYTDNDKLVYDKFYKNNLILYGGNPKDYELIILDISCKHAVCNAKGEVYVLTDKEQEQMAYIWKTYGEPFISSSDANGTTKSPNTEAIPMEPKGIIK